MLLKPLSLLDLKRLRSPSERVPLSEQKDFEKALVGIEQGAFEGYEMVPAPELQLQIFWREPEISQGTSIRVTEKPRQGLHFFCSACGPNRSSCPHRWGAFIVIWQATQLMEAKNDDATSSPSLARLADDLKTFLLPETSEVEQSPTRDFSDVTLDSLSLYPDEPALLHGPALGSLLPKNLAKYSTVHAIKGKELLSPRLWNLPEIFRKPVSAYSEHYLHELNRQNRMADMVRYNFSDGSQISAKEILRHPLQRQVPPALLPQGKTPAPVFARWPLHQSLSNAFVSEALRELDAIMQALLAEVASQLRQGKIEVFLQARSHPEKALPLTTIEFDIQQEMDWRVDFSERQGFRAEFKLVNFRKQDLSYYESFAVDAQAGALIVHPWLKELSDLQQILSQMNETLLLRSQQNPSFELQSELEAKAVLKHLRSRSIPVKVTGESRTLTREQSQIEVHLNEAGRFFIRHEARIPGQASLSRRGWTPSSEFFLRGLSEGLSYLIKNDPKDLASRSRTRREWDLKLLKHLGILQYLFLEALSLHFEGALTDGMVVSPETLFTAVQEKVKALLVAGNNGFFVRETPLSELCSKAILNCFESFIALTFKTLQTSESFYSEQGEIIIEGLVEREFRLLFELLKRATVATGGENFKRSRTSLLSRISDVDLDNGGTFEKALFHFPSGEANTGAGLHSALEALQPLLPLGFRLFYNDQPLQELADDEFQVDFLLQSDDDPKFFNWFELNPKFFLRGEEVDPDQFLKLGGGGVVEYAGKLYLVPQKQMPSLRRLENFWQKLQRGKKESGKRGAGDRIYQLPRHQTLELLALRASGVRLRGDAAWKDLCDFYDRLGEPREPLQMPPSMKGQLKPYQATGVQWLQDLYRLRLGALLADDMGLGKTLQTLCFLDDLRSKGLLGQVLIVVPSSLIFNWQNEVEKFTPELPLTVFSNRDRDDIGRRLGLKEELVVITTYGLLMEHEAFMSQFQWKVLIFDEAQNLKNISAKRTSAARSLTAQFKICLTGTPMENHYGEFYSLVDLLVPGSLGKIDEFRKQFVNTELISREEMADLKLKIKPLLMRRTKKEILDQLPEKQETKVSIAFEDKQKEIYRDIALSYNKRVQETMQVQGEASVQLQMLTALLRLRQACSDPAALPNVRYDKVPPKLETLMDSLHEIVESGESALVFTQFLQTLEHTVALLKEQQVPVYCLHGGIPTKQRQKILADFNNGAGGAVLVMTLKTGGVGLNLTKASYVFHLEPWWNPSVENQATDRAHRLGQSKAVQVFRYIMHESLEEKIEVLKDRKERKFQTLFSNTEKDAEIGTGSAALSKEDFDLLLGLRSE